MIEDYRKLLTLISSFEADRGVKDLFYRLETYMKKTYGLKELYVYSVSDYSVSLREDINEHPRYMRSLWNKKNASEYIGHEKNRAYIIDVLMHKKEVSPNDHIFFLPMGSLDGQFMYAFCPCQTPVPFEIDEYLREFMQRSFNMINKWEEVKKLESLVHVDDVTGLFNQRKLIKDIKLAVDNYKERKERFVVLFIDIDHFKSVNDGHGHLVGTQVLADLATLLMGLMRDNDLCYRYGGDEYVMLIPDATGANGKMIGQRILNTVKNHVFEIDKALLTREQRAHHKDGPFRIQISVSIGVACFPEDAKTEHEILAIADKMMYEAKQSGRGQVCFAGELFGGTQKEG